MEIISTSKAASAVGDKDATQEADDINWVGKGNQVKVEARENQPHGSRDHTLELHSAIRSTCSCSSWEPRRLREEEKKHTKEAAPKEEKPTPLQQEVATSAANLDTLPRTAGPMSSSDNAASVGR